MPRQNWWSATPSFVRLVALPQVEWRGTYAGDVEISGRDASQATVNVPADAAGKEFHVICEVTDNGVHNLTSYRRIVVRPAAR